MLETQPHAGAEELELWNAMYATNISFFDHYWNVTSNYTDPSMPVSEHIDWSDTLYDEWECGIGAKCYGMRYKKREKQGIVRTEHVNGSVEEATYNKNMRNGIRRLIDGR